VETPLVVPFEQLDRRSLALAGGKAANLGEMTRAGLPVPPGFCVTTAAYSRVVAGVDLEPVLSALGTAGDGAALARLARTARVTLLGAPGRAQDRRRCAAAPTGVAERFHGRLWQWRQDALGARTGRRRGRTPGVGFV
jgi:phosphoenolpyruvate synthase/pyruvate phosphate dikinase